MSIWDPAARGLMSAAGGIALILVLIVRVKLPPFLTVLAGALGIGLGAGMDPLQLLQTVREGVGETLGDITPLIGLGCMFGALLQETGAAQRVALTLLERFPERRAPLAMAATGLLVSIAVFFSTGLMILIPVAASMAEKTGKSVFAYAVPLMAGLSTGSAFFPTAAGPILVTRMLGADLGMVALLGIPTAVAATLLAGVLYARRCCRYTQSAAPAPTGSPEAFPAPPFGPVLLVLLLPLALILCAALAERLIPPSGPANAIRFLGNPTVALLLATLAALVLLGVRQGYTMERLAGMMSGSMASAGMILLLIASGGALRFVIQASGVGALFGAMAAMTRLPIALLAFLLAAAIRLCIGSATVSMGMAAGIAATIPQLAEASPLHLAAIVLAIAGGANIFSHVNDSGFWLVKELLCLDELTTIKVWSILETIVGAVGGVLAFAVTLLFV